MRPKVNVSPNERAIIIEYAEDAEISVADAYGELLRAGLRSKGYDPTKHDSE